jgi:hypothetical protein
MRGQKKRKRREREDKRREREEKRREKREGGGYEHESGKRHQTMVCYSSPAPHAAFSLSLFPSLPALPSLSSSFALSLPRSLPPSLCAVPAPPLFAYLR